MKTPATTSPATASRPRPGGRLVFVQSSMGDIPRSLRMMDEHGMEVRIVGEAEGHYERLIVFEAVVPPID